MIAPDKPLMTVIVGNEVGIQLAPEMMQALKLRGHEQRRPVTFLVSETVESISAMSQECFSELHRDWKRSTSFMSNVNQIVSDPSYLTIISWGRMAVPYILKAMAKEPDQWFVALATIMGEDHAKGQMTFDDATKAWLAWGEERGYLREEP